MLILLEGVDGAGKSTLAEALQAELGENAEVRHHGPLRRNPHDEYVDDYTDYVPDSGRTLIADRHYLGEEIWGPLYRDGSALSRAQRRWIELWLLSRGATLWHVTQPLDVIRERLAARGEDFLRPEHVERVHSEFAAQAKSSPLYAGDVSPDGDLTPDVERIVAAARYAETTAAALVPFRSYVGPTLPSALLLGEKRGGQPPWITESAFAQRTQNSGTFLLDALPAELASTVGVANAVEEGDRLPELIDALAGPRVVALGRAASDVLLELGIEHAGVPHPQFAKRFHNKKQKEYGLLISDVISSGAARFSWPS